jgi:hypothetical protein
MSAPPFLLLLSLESVDAIAADFRSGRISSGLDPLLAALIGAGVALIGSLISNLLESRRQNSTLKT